MDKKCPIRSVTRNQNKILSPLEVKRCYSLWKWPKIWSKMIKSDIFGSFHHHWTWQDTLNFDRRRSGSNSVSSFYLWKFSYRISVACNFVNELINFKNSWTYFNVKTIRKISKIFFSRRFLFIRGKGIEAAEAFQKFFFFRGFVDLDQHLFFF